MAKLETYEQLNSELAALLQGERDLIANAANTAALIYRTLPELNWAGFYFLKEGELVVGPFQGEPACTRITLGKGVCGSAAKLRETLLVANVGEFSGHIACDAASKSEVVVPMVDGDRMIGVLDLDSPRLGRFDEVDRDGLEKLVAVFLQATDVPAP